MGFIPPPPPLSAHYPPRPFPGPVAPPPRDPSGVRWTCSFCGGLRLGASCEGCGAARPAGGRPGVPLQIRQPAKDVR